MPPRFTLPTALVLAAVAHGHRHGFDILEATGLGSGTVYPILRRLEYAGLLTSAAERARDAHAAGRPARNYYTLTGAGADALHELLARYPSVAASFARTPQPRGRLQPRPV